jgi:radical SAM superfamily enzyme YgiQ (UPF0313 family)
MNFLFVVPRDNSFGFLTIPPGIVYVATSLKKTGRNVFGIHLNYEDNLELSLRNAIINNKIDVLCIGGLSDQYNEIKNTLKLSKKIKSDLITVIGGGLITAQPQLVMENIGADFGVVGQGEITICELAEALETGKPFQTIDGLTFFENEKLIVNQSRSEVKILDSIPFPDYEIFQYIQVPNGYVNVNGEKKRTVNITASRSCPYNCTFCYHPSGSIYRQRSLNNIFEEIDSVLSKYAIDHLMIIDELFATDEDRVVEFCERISKYKVTFSVQLRVNNISEKLLVKLKQAGCTSIGFGLESADDLILKSMKKKITVSQIENALSLTRKIGFYIQGYFIFGDLEETTETVNTTLRWWLKNLEYGINLAMIRIFPGTHLYKSAIQRSVIPDELQYLENGCPLVNVSKLNNQEFSDLIRKLTYLTSEFLGLTRSIDLEQINTDGSYSISAECLSCGTKNFFPSVVFEYKNINSAEAFCCKTCFQKINAQPSRLISKKTYKHIIDTSLEYFFSKELSEGKRVAIWGVTDKSIALLTSSDILRKSVACIVDRDFKIKNKRVLNQFEVFPPNRLKDIEFDCLIIGAVGYEQEILNSLDSMEITTNILNI